MIVNSSFRTAKYASSKRWVVVIKKKGKDLFVPLPDGLVRDFGIEKEDITIFTMIDKKTFLLQFAKSTMCSKVTS